jgi:catechol 2,3-dioxygenase-like lactoylglutathione lyase family enzyme
VTIQRMDNVLIVVDDLEAVVAFFVELGMELEGKGPLEGRWAERVIGLDDVRQDIAMLRTPDGHGRVELAKFHRPKAINPEPKDPPANTLGIRTCRQRRGNGCASFASASFSASSTFTTT